MAAMSKHERRAPFEQLRRNRLGDLWKLIENRYGSRVLPDDDAGRWDLFELLLLISLGERPAAKMQNTIETAAPWLSAEEAESMVAHITVALDRHERWCSPRVLGNRLRQKEPISFLKTSMTEIKREWSLRLSPHASLNYVPSLLFFKASNGGRGMTDETKCGVMMVGR